MPGRSPRPSDATAPPFRETTESLLPAAAPPITCCYERLECNPDGAPAPTRRRLQLALRKTRVAVRQLQRLRVSAGIFAWETDARPATAIHSDRCRTLSRNTE